MLSNKPQHYAVVETLVSLQKAPISIPNICKAVHNLFMPWMCQWMQPYHITASLVGQVSQMLLQIPGNPKQQTTALCTLEINKLLNKLSQILLCTIWIDKGLFDCRV